MTSVFVHPILVVRFNVICSILRDTIYDRRIITEYRLEVFDMFGSELGELGVPLDVVAVRRVLDVSVRLRGVFASSAGCCKSSTLLLSNAKALEVTRAGY